MKIPEIKRLAQAHSIDELNTAEDCLLSEKALPFLVNGDDEGEQLTHIIAAREILFHMASEGLELNRALRNYTQRVRNSIS